MPQNSTHPSYDEAEPIWQTVRDCVGGGTMMRKNAIRYVPMLWKQTLAEFAAYVARAVFFNACKRTTEAFLGFIFRQNPEITMKPESDETKDFLMDANLRGKSFYDHARKVVGEVLQVGRGGTLVDWSDPEARPFVTYYRAEDILNWQYRRIKGKTVLSRVILHETTSDDGTDPKLKLPSKSKADPYEQEQIEQWRELVLTDDGSGGVFAETIVWRRRTDGTNKAGDFYVAFAHNPARFGKTIDRLTFVFHAPVEDTDPERLPVPLEDIAELNVGYFRNSADYENALHAAGQPTPIACGFDPDVVKELTLGTKRAWISDDPNAKASFLAYNAQDASAITEAMESKKREMAALGARMLEQQGSGKGQEAFETVQIRQAGDMSALMAVTISCTQSLSDVLQLYAWWTQPKLEEPAEAAENFQIELNTEFVELMMEAPMLTAIVSAYIAGALSYDAMFEKFQKSGMISAEVKIEEERARLAKSPVMQPSPVATGDQQPGTKPGAKPAPGKAAPPKGGTPGGRAPAGSNT